MMNVFYHDRITTNLATIETAISKLTYAEANNAMVALQEVRGLVNTTYEPVSYTHLTLPTICSV